jgi:hypothetical protein
MIAFSIELYVGKVNIENNGGTLLYLGKINIEMD